MRGKEVRGEITMTFAILYLVVGLLYSIYMEKTGLVPYAIPFEDASRIVSMVLIWPLFVALQIFVWVINRMHEGEG